MTPQTRFEKNPFYESLLPTIKKKLESKQSNVIYKTSKLIKLRIYISSKFFFFEKKNNSEITR